MKKRAIPPPPIGDRFSEAVKENLEVIMGQRVPAITELPTTATTADIIAKVNELLRRLQ